MRTTKTVMGTLVLAATVAAGACDDGTSLDLDPSMAVVAGAYTAEGSFGTIQFTTTTAGSPEVTDWLAAGASLVMTLSQDGTTSGRIFIPGADEDGGDFDEDLVGTWSLDDGVVTLDQPADTFLRDMPFSYANGVLTGEETFSDTTIRVVLQRR